MTPTTSCSHLGQRFTADGAGGPAQTPRGAHRHSDAGEEDRWPHAEDRRAELRHPSSSIGTPLSERVLLPAMRAESKGMEDARFVRFVEDDGSVTYYASYTAYDGNDISQQLLETTDFLHFTSSPIVGAAAANKGLALFPRRIGGRFAALSRSDRESNTIAYLRESPTLGRGAAVPGADDVLGGRATRQLRATDRDRRRLAGAHPRRRPHAHLQHRSHPARPRGPHPGRRPAARAPPEPSSRRAGRVRAQRRLLLRCPPPCGHPGPALRNRRLPPSAWRPCLWTNSSRP